MYRKILIATDGSELSGKGVEHGLKLAAALGAEALLVTVTDPWQPVSTWTASSEMAEEYRKRVTAEAERILDEAAKRASELGVTHHGLHVPDRYPAEAILETSAGRGCDLVVMATHGRRGLGRLLIGSQANAVITHSRIPVLVVR